MASTTSRLELYMPADDGSEPINVATDINDNLEKLDSATGFVPATELTPPVNIYDGKARYNTDSGVASFWRAASNTWTQILTAGAVFASNLILGGPSRIGMGTANPTAMIDSNTSNITTYPFIKYRQLSEAFPRLQIDHESIGFGGGTLPPDVEILRPAPNQISVTGSVSLANDLSVTGDTSLSSLDVSGDVSIGGSVTTDVNVTGTVSIAEELSGTGIGITHYLRRNGDLARASQGTPSVDSAFDYMLEANCSYFVEMFICYAGLNAADFKCSWIVPTGSSGPRWCLGMPAGGTDISNTAMSTTTTGFTTDFSYGTQTATAFAGAQEVLSITTSSTPGLLQFKWSQANSSPTATILRNNSMLKIRKVA